MEEKLEWSELQNILNIVVALLLVTGKLEAHTMSIAPASGRSGFWITVYTAYYVKTA